MSATVNWVQVLEMIYLLFLDINVITWHKKNDKYCDPGSTTTPDEGPIQPSFLAFLNHVWTMFWDILWNKFKVIFCQRYEVLFYQHIMLLDYQRTCERDWQGVFFQGAGRGTHCVYHISWLKSYAAAEEILICIALSEFNLLNIHNLDRNHN